MACLENQFRKEYQGCNEARKPSCPAARCDQSSLYTTDTKIRALQTVWDFKRLPKAEPEKRKLSLEGQSTSIVYSLYCAEDALLDMRGRRVARR